MHRSGTSIVTRAVNLLGAQLPTNLLPANEHNEQGYWEPKNIVDIHDELLASAGSSWHDVSPFPRSWYRSVEARQFRDRLVEAVRVEYGESPFFVLKDPRISKFVPFWLSVLENVNAQPLFINVYRQPLEVAASLNTRDRMVPAHSLLLWLRYVLDAEYETRGCRRAFLSYEGLLRNWRTALSRVSDDLEIEWPQLTHEAAVQIEATLSDRYRHHSFSSDELMARPDILDWVKQTHEVMELGDGGAKATGLLDEIRQQLDVADRAFGPILAEQRLRTSTFKTEVERLAEELTTFRSETGRLNEELATSRSETGRLNEELATSRSETGRLNEELATRIVEVRRLSEELESSQRGVERLELELAGSQGQVGDLREQMAAQASRLATVEEEAGRLSADLEGFRDQLHSREEQLREAGSLLSVTRQERLEVSSILNSVMQSRSWRVTRPLRWLVAKLRYLLTLPIFDRVHWALAEGREPIGSFDRKYYLARYPDVAAAGINPLVHYVRHGKAAGRKGAADNPAFAHYEDLESVARSGLFDSGYYLRTNPDVRAKGFDPLEHFLEVGAWEGKRPNPDFDPDSYRKQYLAVTDSEVNPLVHYILAEEARAGIRFPKLTSTSTSLTQCHSSPPT
ncbi:MAG: hypothetical protein WBO69_13200 [Thermoanaerobaculia bacterium]